MAVFPLLVCCMIAFSLDVIQADPEFPTFPDDYTAIGTFRLKSGLIRFRLLYSKSLKASKFEIKSFGKRESRYILENEGAYGTEVHIKSSPGNELCTIHKGTAKSPIKYESYFSTFFNHTKYVGIENINGEDMKKWQFYDEDATGFIIIREDKNGPAPYSVSKHGKTISFQKFSSASPTPSDFKYNKSACRRTQGHFWAFQNFPDEPSFLPVSFMKKN